ncbi:uncharacterized protein LOC100213018 isoform X4 [Hydra vulgaris]|uniref:Uncharacterized protein LOC100213018 isoform X4 n=1 Tax=Hydra vulgaris TaxID=6087 RepID=A0ABM4CJ03_HYDVU
MITRMRKNGRTESKLGVIDHAKKAIETCKIKGVFISDQSLVDNRRRKQGVVEDHPLFIIDTEQQCKLKRLSWLKRCNKESKVEFNFQTRELSATESTNLLQRNSENLDERVKENKITSSRTISSPILPRFFKTFIKELEALEEYNTLNKDPLIKIKNSLLSNQITDQSSCTPLMIGLEFNKANDTDLLQYPQLKSNSGMNTANLNVPIKFAYKRCLLNNSEIPKINSTLSPDLSLRIIIRKSYTNSPKLPNERQSVPLNFIPGVKDAKNLKKIRKTKLLRNSLNFVEHVTFCFQGISFQINKDESKTFKALAHAACMGLAIPAPSTHACNQ